MFSPNLQCASALLNVTLRSLVLAAQDAQKEEQSESSKGIEVRVSTGISHVIANGDHVLEYFLQTTRAVLLELCENLELFSACRKVRASPTYAESSGSSANMRQ